MWERLEDNCDSMRTELSHSTSKPRRWRRKKNKAHEQCADLKEHSISAAKGKRNILDEGSASRVVMTSVVILMLIVATPESCGRKGWSGVHHRKATTSPSHFQLAARQLRGSKHMRMRSWSTVWERKGIRMIARKIGLKEREDVKHR